MSINRIPDELWGMIFDYVGQSTFDEHPEPLKRRLNFGPRVSLVCKSWHRVAETIPSIWQNIDLKLPRKSDGFEKMYPYIKSIDLLHKRCKGVSGRGYLKTIYTTVEKSNVIEAIKFATKSYSGDVLDHLEIRFSTTLNFTFVSPLTKSLDIDILDNDEYADCHKWRYVDFVESQVTILENLRVHGCEVPSRALNYCMRLKHLDIGGQEDAHIFEDDLEDEYEDSPPPPPPSLLRDRLITLKLRDSSWVRNTSLRHRTWLLPTVRHLSLTERGMDWLPKLELPALETFELGRLDELSICTNIFSRRTQERFTNIARNLKGLSIRSLDDPEITDVLLDADLSNVQSISLFKSSRLIQAFRLQAQRLRYKALKQFTISQEQGIEYSQLTPLLDKSTGIEELRVSKKIAGTFDEHDLLKKFLVKETEYHYIFHPRALNCRQLIP